MATDDTFSAEEIELLLADVNTSEEVTSDNLDKLEVLVSRANEMNLSPTEQLIPDAIYDHITEIVRKYRPESPVLTNLWEETDEVSLTDSVDLFEETNSGVKGQEDDKYFYEYPMMSIQTQKSWSDPGLRRFSETLVEKGCPDLFASYKVNGHGIRIVYKDGVMLKARSRARASEGRDLTRQMVNILGESCEGLKGYGLVEIRGEVALPVDRLDQARQFNPDIKSAFTAVSSLIKPASVEEENKLLEFYAYWIKYEGVENELSSKTDEYEKLEELGFITPSYFTIDDEYTSSTEAMRLIKEVFQEAEEGYEEQNLYCDGLVVQINDNRIFESTPIEGNYRLGNVALKVGIWEQNMYSGIVQTIIWTRGKNKRTPVAIISEHEGEAKLTDANGYGTGSVLNMEQLGVLTATGNRVRNVPLYEPRNILILDAYPGNVIHFRYGGEAGVVPCFSDGSLLTEDVSKALLENNLN